MSVENFTTYTEVEEITDIFSVAANKIDFTDAMMDESSYVYKDFGVGYFGDFTHLVTFYLSSTNLGSALCWHGYGQQNEITDFYSATGDALITFMLGRTGFVYSIYCEEKEGGVNGDFDFFDISVDTPYYLTISRNGTVYQVLIYDDAGRTNLVDTLLMACITTAFQYCMAAETYDMNVNADRRITGYIENLDLQERKVSTVATWANWAKQAVSKKTVLVEMDIGRLQTAWHNERAGVWGHKFDTYKEIYHALGQGNLGYGSLGGSGTLESGNKLHPMSIGSVKGDTTSFTSQGSLASVQSAVQSFYYDYDTSMIYIHCTNSNDPVIFNMILGFTLGLSNKAININNAYYEPRVRGIPVLSKTKDPLFFGIIKHDGGSIELDNHDGFFDDITDDYIFGQPVIIKYGGDYHDKIMPYANYRKVFTGHIEGHNINWETMTIDVIHNIKRLARTIPIRKYTSADFPNLNADDLGKPRPIAYGEVYHAQVVCTNKDETSADWVFECADTTDHASGILSVTAAYLDGVDLAIKSQSQADGTFTVSETAYLPVSTHKGKKVMADFSAYAEGGSLIKNVCDVMKDIASVYGSITYNATNYDTAEWESEDDDALDCGLFIDDEIDIEEVFGQLCQSTFGVFIEKDDGRYTFRIVDTTAAADETIRKDIITGSPEVPADGTLFLSSCKIGYKKDWGEKKYRWLNETTDETDIAARHGKYSEKKFETLLTNSTDAQTLATRLMNYYSKVKPDIMITIPIEYIDFEIGDIKNINTDRKNTAFMGTVKTEITGITKNIGLKDERDHLVLMGRKCD